MVAEGNGDLKPALSMTASHLIDKASKHHNNIIFIKSYS